jgi:hypothetical protein
LSRWRRRRRRRIHHHGYGAGFLVLSRVDSTTTPSSCSSCTSAWLLRREAVRIIDGGVGFGGFQAIDFRGSGRWNVAAGALIAVGNGNDGRCQAMKKGRERGAIFFLSFFLSSSSLTLLDTKYSSHDKRFVTMMMVTKEKYSAVVLTTEIWTRRALKPN